MLSRPESLATSVEAATTIVITSIRSVAIKFWARFSLLHVYGQNSINLGAF